MENPLVLTIDFGTQSVRVALVNKQGEIEALERAKYQPAYFSPKPGYAEQDPEFYFENLCTCTKALVNNNKDKMSRVIGISMAFFRDSVVPVGFDGKPLRPAILWLDERRAEDKEKLPALNRAIFKLIGMGPTIDLNRKRSMAVWIQENEPEIWEKTDKFMFLSTYINKKLVGEFVDSVSCQAGHMPIDFKKGRWYKSDKHIKGSMFGVPGRMLCKLVKAGEVLGTITLEASKATGLPMGLVVFAGGSDKSAETLGLGVFDDKTAAISYGTACTVEVPIEKYSDAEPFLPSYPDIIKGYNLDVQIYRGYWMLNWFIKQFGSQGPTVEEMVVDGKMIEEFNKEMEKIEPGCNGLVLQPYWGPGLRRPLAKGAIVGFSDVHTKMHMYRAIVEGIAFALREGLELFEKKRLHHKVSVLRISGGGSQSDVICQITADIFNRPVSRIQTYECSTLGCAMSAFIAHGDFKNKREAAESMIRISKTFTPNPENAKKYDYLFNNVYMKVYPQLKNLYKEIKEFDDQKW
jgi:sugar (pentulose or hexulose) kinase